MEAEHLKVGHALSWEGMFRVISETARMWILVSAVC
jgi:hypothetical protein